MGQLARIVLLAAQGVSNTAIAAMVGVPRPTVILWRNRYAQAGIAGLGDLARSGRPPVIDDLQVVVETLAAPPEHLGVTHWSARLPAKELRMRHANQDDYVNLDDWDFGYVVAVVKHPASYQVPKTGWKSEDVNLATVLVDVALPPGVGPLVRLIRASAREQRERPPHAALIAVKGARALMARDQLFFPEGGPTVGSVFARHPLRIG